MHKVYLAQGLVHKNYDWSFWPQGRTPQLGALGGEARTRSISSEFPGDTDAAGASTSL